MIAVLTTFTLPKPITREEARSIFLSTAPKYRAVQGFVSEDLYEPKDLFNKSSSFGAGGIIDILAGQQPRTPGLQSPLNPLPAIWTAQRNVLGFALIVSRSLIC